MSDDDPSQGSTEPSPRAFDLGVFTQDLVWTDVEGWGYPLAEMSDGERSALQAWLRANSKHFYLQSLREALLETALTHIDQWADPWPAPDAELPDLIFLSDMQWLEGTALMRALRRA
jgi:CheY-like chemotaxis protein